jgi:zinc transporter ZupT
VVLQGLMTFMTAMAQQDVGIVLAFAIGLHNLFEGGTFPY